MVPKVIVLLQSVVIKRVQPGEAFSECSDLSFSHRGKERQWRGPDTTGRRRVSGDSPPLPRARRAGRWHQPDRGHCGGRMSTAAAGAEPSGTASSMSLTSGTQPDPSLSHLYGDHCSVVSRKRSSLYTTAIRERKTQCHCRRKPLQAKWGTTVSVEESNGLAPKAIQYLSLDIKRGRLSERTIGEPSSTSPWLTSPRCFSPKVKWRL
jgi:hypothetical protein